mmetsp:Transcript_17533/g.52708  ORF Transcript_17533/g.52708 Transcript_17533/m.52708 type:complete len:114 (-) Transcript_17533:342-683(-)
MALDPSRQQQTNENGPMCRPMTTADYSRPFTMGPMQQDWQQSKQDWLQSQQLCHHGMIGGCMGIPGPWYTETQNCAPTRSPNRHRRLPSFPPHHDIVYFTDRAKYSTTKRSSF